MARKFNSERITEKRVAVLVWEEDGFYVEHKVSDLTREDLEYYNRTFGFAPKGVIKDHSYWINNREVI